MKRSIALMGLVFAFGGAPALAEEIRFCYEDWAPYSTPTDAGAQGIQITLTREALKRMGHDAVFEELPYKRCVAETAAGVYDAMLLTDTEPDLVPNMVSTASWLVGFYVHEDSPLESYDSLEAFAGMTLGVVDGYEYPEAIEAYDGWTRQAVTDAAMNLRKLTAGRINLVLDDVPWVQSVIKAEGLPLRRLRPLFSNTPQYTHFAPGRDHLITPYDAALSAILADGTVDTVYQAVLGVSFTDMTTDLAVFGDGS